MVAKTERLVAEAAASAARGFDGAGSDDGDGHISIAAVADEHQPLAAFLLFYQLDNFRITQILFNAFIYDLHVGWALNCSDFFFNFYFSKNLLGRLLFYAKDTKMQELSEY